MKEFILTAGEIYSYAAVVVIILMIFDWMFAFDKISSGIDIIMTKYCKYLPVESISPLLIFTFVSTSSLVMHSIFKDTDVIFGLLYPAFGVASLGYVGLLILGSVIVRGLIKFRQFMIDVKKPK